MAGRRAQAPPLRKGAPRSGAGPGSNAQTPICSAHAGKGVRITPRDPALRPRPPAWTGRGRLLSGHVSTADLPQPPADTAITPSFEFPLFPDKIVFKKAKLQTRVTRPEMVKGGAREPACPGRPAPDVTQPHVHRSACVSRRKMPLRRAGPGPSTYLARGLRVVAKGAPGSRAWGSGRCCGHWVCVSKPGSEQRDPDPVPRCCFPARCGPDAGPCSQTPPCRGRSRGVCRVRPASPRASAQRATTATHDGLQLHLVSRSETDVGRPSHALYLPRQKFPTLAIVTSHISLRHLLRPTVSPHLGACGLC